MEEIKNRVLKYAKPGYEIEIYAERIKKTVIESAQESLENLSRSEEVGVGIRVLRENRIGFAYTTDFKEEYLRECLERSYEVCDMLPPDPANALYDAPIRGDLTDIFDSEGVNIPLEEKIDTVLNLEKRAKELDGRVKGVRKASLKEIIAEFYHFNTLGVDYYYRTTYYTSMIAVLAQKGHDSAISYDYRAQRVLKDMDLEGMVRDAVFKCVSQLNPEPFQTCKMPVILYREASAMLLDTFSSMFLGDALVKNKTLLKDKMGERVASKLLTIVDDGRMKGGFMSLPVDAEGVKTQRKEVISEGVFSRFLHSLYSARKTQAEPTGNGVRRSFRSLPTSGITNLYIANGDKKLEELLSSCERVFLILDLMGLHTADPVSGEFSLGASGIIFKNGEREKAVRGVVIGGDILSLWSNVIGIGNDLCFYANVGSPSLLIESLVIGG